MKILDGTQVRLAHTPELIKEFGQLKSQYGYNHYPCVQLLVLKDGFSYQPLHAQLGRCDVSERTIAREVFASLAANDVVLLDRGLGGQEVYRMLYEKKVFFIHRVACKGRGVAIYLQDFINSGEASRTGELGRIDDKLKLQLRMVRTILPNGELIVYVTNLLDQASYKDFDIHTLYAQRWSVETTFGYMKATLNIEGIKAKTANSVRQDIFAHLILLAVSAQVQDRAANILKLDPSKARPSLKNIFVILRKNMIELITATDLNKVWKKIIKLAQEIIWVKQPGRSRPRYSMQPQNRWSNDRYRRKKTLT